MNGAGEAMMPRRSETLGFDARPNVRDRLEMELAILDQRRAEVEEALRLLDRNPDTERLMDLIRS